MAEHGMKAREDTAKTGAVTVVGGGIAGIQSALDMANAGYKVYLVEEQPNVGGVMAQLDKTFPTNDCSSCMMGPKLVELSNHRNIEILTRTTVECLRGEPGRFTLTLRRYPRFVREDRCTGCGECSKVCPIDIAADFNLGLDQRKAIYRNYPQAIPPTFTIDKRGVAPCKHACPAGISVQGYVALITQKRYQEALNLIKQNNPFPAICGRVCNHPCELACNRAQIDEPIATEFLHRFVADLDLGSDAPSLPPRRDEKGRKVAIIGAGPGGLTAAYYLAIEGYAVTIFEAMTEAGGWLRYGIPEYRLPRDILRAEIDVILRLGVELRTGVALGRDISLAGLRADGYEAIFIAIGTQKSTRLNVPGEDLPGVYFGGDFLKEVNSGRSIALGEKVAIVGGGNVAMDAARTSLRLGAKEVHVLYRRSRDEMPANEEEIEEAEEEGIHFHYLTAPIAVIANDAGRVGHVRCLRMALGEPDASGRRRPVPVEGSEHDVAVDSLISAIGLASDLDFMEQTPLELRPGVTHWGTFQVDPVTYATNVPGIFAGGDVVTGAATVVEAIKAGRQAAISIDRMFMGEDLAAGRDVSLQPVDLPAGHFPRAKRMRMPRLAPAARRGSFDEVQLGFSEEEALQEAARCLQCGICSECYRCVDACMARAIDHEMPEELVEVETGAIVFAPGFLPFDARRKPELGYGLWPNVVTSLEYERILSAAGPFAGHIQRLSDGRQPHRMAWIQCVGSRDASIGRDYCSSVCCMYATKQAMITKEHHADIDTTIFYIDMRAQGKGFDRFYERARDEVGVRYIRSMISRVVPVPETDSLLITYIDANNTLCEEEFDMVVLSVGLSPHPSTARTAERLGLKLNSYGFCTSDPMDLVATAREGVFVCGVTQGPKDIPETVQQGSSAAACATALLAEARGSLITPPPRYAERDVRGEAPRIGVFVCHCGINIAGTVDVAAVADYAAKLPDVVYTSHCMFACSSDQQTDIKRVIDEHRLNRIIVASCTPRTHEPLFRNTLKEGGLNPYLFELANIREHDSWVHQREPQAATEKAKDLVRMSVSRARLLEPLHDFSYSVVQRAMVIGGGLAGMTAALAVAEQGFPAVLVERSDQLGGNARTLYFTEDGVSGARYVEELIRKVEASPLITVFQQAELKATAGSCGNFISTIATGGIEQDVSHGVMIVATGGEEYQPNEYLYGQHARVVTQKEFEAMLVQRPEVAKLLRRVVMIQCVGSREPDFPYCSRVCCTAAVKNSLKLQQLNPRAEISILYRDIRTFSFKELHYQQARRQGVRFLRFDWERKPSVEADGQRLKIEFFDANLRLPIHFEADLLVLSAAIRPRVEGKRLAEVLRLPLDQDGFFMEAHVKLRPLDFAAAGIFLCGLAQGPKFANEAIAQARGAVSRALTILSRKEIVAEAVVNQVNAELCRACGECEKTCVFGAIKVMEVAPGVRRAVVNEGVCTGCGACNVACPTGAASLAHFRDEQVNAMIAALA
jgi:heterodisulfide reductase subunit A-like polyferredoxin